MGLTARGALLLATLGVALLCVGLMCGAWLIWGRLVGIGFAAAELVAVGGLCVALGLSTTLRE